MTFPAPLPPCRRRSLACVPLLLAGALTAAPHSLAAQAQLPPPIELRVPRPPTAAQADGRTFLAYELHVTNFGTLEQTIRSIEVRGADADGDAQPLFMLQDSVLARALGRPGVAPTPPLVDRARVAGGLRAVVFLWVPVDRDVLPSALRHRLSLYTTDSTRLATVQGATTPVDTAAAVIGPPLRGGNWLTGNGPDPMTGHRRALIVTDGAATIAQRFAIDYVKVNDRGTTSEGDRERNESYHAWGEEALAVTDGIVVDVKDSIPENVPGITSRAVPITLETVGGNYVILDIGGARYAFYAHLQPGSLRVAVGDTVRRGQVLGLVGNSGNSTEPHLHFHVADGIAPLGAEGVPYAHDRFEIVGRCRRPFAECAPVSPEARTGEIPPGNVVIRFP